LLTFLAFYAVVSQRNKTGALLLGIAVTLKVYPLVTLPAFFAYILKKRNKIDAGKFLLYTFAVPILFTVFVFAVFRWDILYFLRTIFYLTPVFETNPVLIQGGAMNIWSFLALLNINIARISLLRLLWIPVLAVSSFYWLRKTKLDDASLNLSIISLYVLFMLTYGWVTEQTFLDLLPFIFLQIFAYRPKRNLLYLLVIIQILIFAFSAVNWGVFIFQPLVTRFSPSLLPLMQHLDPSASSLIWTIRGVLGLIVSISLAGFLTLLMKPSILKRTKKNPSPPRSIIC
jgi:hypothetical protein